MSAAAKRLGMTPSAVSQAIRALEARTGVVLLHRSTRRLTLTETGGRFLPHCLRMVEAAEAAAASLEQARDAPVGELRIAAPIGFGAHLSLALAPILTEWPGLRLRLIVDDRLINLVEARIDIAIRVGSLPDTSWIGRKLCDFDRIVCASPAYLERQGAPGTPADLPRYDWLTTAVAEPNASAMHGEGATVPEPLTLDLTNVAGVRDVQDITARIVTTTQVALLQLCEEGLGLAPLFYPDARPALERGALIRVLPNWRLPSAPITLVTPRPEGDAAKVRVAVAALARYFVRLTRVN